MEAFLAEDGFQQFKKEVAEIYRRKGLEKGKICSYCGSGVDPSRDHPIPLTYFSGDRTKANLLFYNSGWHTIPSCKSCNFLASVSLNTSFADRKNTILERFEKRYRKEIKSKAWTKDQLKTLSGMLRTAVREANEWDNYIKLRYENLKNPNPIYESII